MFFVSGPIADDAVQLVVEMVEPHSLDHNASPHGMLRGVFFPFYVGDRQTVKLKFDSLLYGHPKHMQKTAWQVVWGSHNCNVSPFVLTTEGHEFFSLVPAVNRRLYCQKVLRRYTVFSENSCPFRTTPGTVDGLVPLQSVDDDL